MSNQDYERELDESRSSKANNLREHLSSYERRGVIHTAQGTLAVRRVVDGGVRAGYYDTQVAMTFMPPLPDGNARVVFRQEGDLGEVQNTTDGLLRQAAELAGIHDAEIARVTAAMGGIAIS